MKFLVTIFIIALITTIHSYSNTNVSNVTYYDLKGKNHSVSLPYILNPQKVQYGVKFGIMMYYIEVKDCKLKIGEDMIEYFAAYLSIKSDCNLVDIVKDTISHGADFIFVDVSNFDDYSILTSKSFDIPIFLIDKSVDKDAFRFSEVDYDRRYINIEFVIVS